MSRTILLTPTVSLIEEVASHLLPQGADYSANLVIFPGTRPAHFLRKALGDIQGKSYVPPAIHSLDGFIDLLFEVKPGAGPKVTPVDAAVILFRIHSTLSERIGGKEFDSFERFLPIGLRIFEELEELMMTCLPPKRIVPLLHGVSLRGIHSLGTLYERFYPEVVKLGYSTRAMRHVAATDGSTQELLGRFSTIVIAGLFALTEAERRLVHALAGRKETVLIFQDGPGVRKRIDDLELVVEEKGELKGRPPIEFLAAPDSHGEIFALANRFEELREAGEKLDHRCVVLVPDPTVLPSLVHHALSMLDDPYNISIGYPHSRTPIVGFLRSLMNAVSGRHEEKFQASDYLNVVLHPYVKSIPLEGKPHATRILLHRLEECFLEGDLPPFFRLEDLEARDEVFLHAARSVADEGITPESLRGHLRRIHEKIILPLTHAGSVGDCARGCIDVLSTVANESSSRQHMFFRSSMESILSTLGSLCQSLLGEMKPDDPAATLSIVRNCVNEGRIPLPGTPLQGLQVLGFLETRNLRFDNVFILNANDDQIPGDSGQYSLIPQMVRRELGLDTRGERDRIAEYYFSLLVHGAQRVTILFTDNESKSPSRFVEKILWEEEQAGQRGLEGVDTADYKITLTHEKPSPVQKSGDMVEAVKKIHFSATALDLYLKCGIQFYYRYVLRLKEKEELESDVDRRGQGFFVHNVLAEYYMPFVGAELDTAKMDVTSLGRVVDESFRKEFGDEEFGNKYLLKIQIKRHLSRFLEEFEIPRLKGGSTRLLGVETKVNIEKDGYLFSGTIDRIEEREGRNLIYDYKTTGDKSKLVIRPHLLDLNDRKGWSKAIGSLQLPLYMLLASGGMGKDISTVAPSYLLLGKGSFDPSPEITLFDSPEMRGTLYPQLESVIFSLLRELTDVAKPFSPPDDLQEACPYCPFTQLCGTEWVKRKSFS